MSLISFSDIMKYFFCCFNLIQLMFTPSPTQSVDNHGKGYYRNEEGLLYVSLGQGQDAKGQGDNAKKVSPRHHKKEDPVEYVELDFNRQAPQESTYANVSPTSI